MTQNIIALIIVALVLLKTVYSVYKAVTTKDKAICGGCASCDLKNELKKKGKLYGHTEVRVNEKINFSAEHLKYSAKE